MAPNVIVTDAQAQPGQTDFSRVRESGYLFSCPFALFAAKKPEPPAARSGGASPGKNPCAC
jgi:hypothetical protein